MQAHIKALYNKEIGPADASSSSFGVTAMMAYEAKTENVMHALDTTCGSQHFGLCRAKHAAIFDDVHIFHRRMAAITKVLFRMSLEFAATQVGNVSADRIKSSCRVVQRHLRDVVGTSTGPVVTTCQLRFHSLRMYVHTYTFSSYVAVVRC